MGGDDRRVRHHLHPGGDQISDREVERGGGGTGRVADDQLEGDFVQGVAGGVAADDSFGDLQPRFGDGDPHRRGGGRVHAVAGNVERRGVVERRPGADPHVAGDVQHDGVDEDHERIVVRDVVAGRRNRAERERRIGTGGEWPTADDRIGHAATEVGGEQPAAAGGGRHQGEAAVLHAGRQVVGEGHPRRRGSFRQGHPQGVGDGFADADVAARRAADIGGEEGLGERSHGDDEVGRVAGRVVVQPADAILAGAFAGGRARCARGGGTRAGQARPRDAGRVPRGAIILVRYDGADHGGPELNGDGFAVVEAVGGGAVERRVQRVPGETQRREERPAGLGDTPRDVRHAARQRIEDGDVEGVGVAGVGQHQLEGQHVAGVGRDGLGERAARVVGLVPHRLGDRHGRFDDRHRRGVRSRRGAGAVVRRVGRRHRGVAGVARAAAVVILHHRDVTRRPVAVVVDEQREGVGAGVAALVGGGVLDEHVELDDGEFAVHVVVGVVQIAEAEEDVLARTVDGRVAGARAGGRGEDVVVEECARDRPGRQRGERRAVAQNAGRAEAGDVRDPGRGDVAAAGADERVAGGAVVEEPQAGRHVVLDLEVPRGALADAHVDAVPHHFADGDVHAGDDTGHGDRIRQGARLARGDDRLADERRRIDDRRAGHPVVVECPTVQYAVGPAAFERSGVVDAAIRDHPVQARPAGVHGVRHDHPGGPREDPAQRDRDLRVLGHVDVETGRELKRVADDDESVGQQPPGDGNGATPGRRDAGDLQLPRARLEQRRRRQRIAHRHVVGGRVGGRVAVRDADLVLERVVVVAAGGAAEGAALGDVADFLQRAQYRFDDGGVGGGRRAGLIPGRHFARGPLERGRVVPQSGGLVRQRVEHDDAVRDRDRFGGGVVRIAVDDGSEIERDGSAAVRHGRVRGRIAQGRQAVGEGQRRRCGHRRDIDERQARVERVDELRSVGGGLRDRHRHGVREDLADGRLVRRVVAGRREFGADERLGDADRRHRDRRGVGRVAADGGEVGAPLARAVVPHDGRVHDRLVRGGRVVDPHVVGEDHRVAAVDHVRQRGRRAREAPAERAGVVVGRRRRRVERCQIVRQVDLVALRRRVVAVVEGVLGDRNRIGGVHRRSRRRDEPQVGVGESAQDGDGVTAGCRVPVEVGGERQRHRLGRGPGDGRDDVHTILRGGGLILDQHEVADGQRDGIDRARGPGDGASGDRAADIGGGCHADNLIHQTPVGELGAVAAPQDALDPGEEAGRRGRGVVLGRDSVLDDQVVGVAAAGVLGHHGEADLFARVAVERIRRADGRGLGPGVDRPAAEVGAGGRGRERDTTECRAGAVDADDALVHGHGRPHQLELPDRFERLRPVVRGAFGHLELVRQAQVAGEREVGDHQRDQDVDGRRSPGDHVLERAEVQRDRIGRRVGGDERRERDRPDRAGAVEGVERLVRLDERVAGVDGAGGDADQDSRVRFGDGVEVGRPVPGAGGGRDHVDAVLGRHRLILHQDATAVHKGHPIHGRRGSGELTVRRRAARRVVGSHERGRRRRVHRGEELAGEGLEVAGGAAGRFARPEGDFVRGERRRRRGVEIEARARRHREDRQRREVRELQILEARDRQRVPQPVGHPVADLHRRQGTEVRGRTVHGIKILRLDPPWDDHARGGVVGAVGAEIRRRPVGEVGRRQVIALDQRHGVAEDVPLVHEPVAGGEVVAERLLHLDPERDPAARRPERGRVGVLRVPPAVGDLAADEDAGQPAGDQLLRNVESQCRRAVDGPGAIVLERRPGRRAGVGRRVGVRRPEDAVVPAESDRVRTGEGAAVRRRAGAATGVRPRVVDRQGRPESGREVEPLAVAEHVVQEEVVDGVVVRHFEVEVVAQQRRAGGDRTAGWHVQFCHRGDSLLDGHGVLLQHVGVRGQRATHRLVRRSVAPVERRPVAVGTAGVVLEDAVGAAARVRQRRCRLGENLGAACEIARDEELEDQTGVVPGDPGHAAEVADDRAAGCGCGRRTGADARADDNPAHRLNDIRGARPLHRVGEEIADLQIRDRLARGDVHVQAVALLVVRPGRRFVFRPEVCLLQREQIRRDVAI